MISKKQLKTELNLPTVAIIGEILKAAGRDPKGQNVEDADAALVRKAVPHWRKGHDYVEAVRMAKAELLGEADQQATEGNPVNGSKPANSTLALQSQVVRQQASLDKKNETFSQQATLTKAVGDERKNQALYWYARAAAATSPQVQESEEVVTARDFYFQMQSGSVADVDVVANLEETLSELGFFGGDLELLPEMMEPVTAETDSTFYSPEAYSSVNGYATGN